MTRSPASAVGLVAALTLLMLLSFAVVIDTPRSPCTPACPAFTVPPVNTRSPLETVAPDVDFSTTSAEIKTQLGIERIEGATTVELVTLLALALVANRLTELVKKGLSEKFTNLPEWIVLLISLIVGVVLALARQANLFTDGAVNPVLGMVLTGVVIGGASNFTHSLTEIVSTWQESFERKESPATPAPLTIVNAPTVNTPSAQVGNG